MLSQTVQAAASGDTVFVLLAGAIVVSVAVLGFLVLLPWLKRRYLSGRAGHEAAEGFRIDDLERMRRSGHITEDEFRRLRRLALRLDVRAGGGDNSSSSTSPPNDDGQDIAGQEKPREDAG